MKTRDEIIATAMMDWNTKRKSDDNWLKSRIEGAWNSGYANAEAEYKEKNGITKNIFSITPFCYFI